MNDQRLPAGSRALYKTELIKPNGPWRGLDDIELRTLEWVDWHNNRRLHTACYDLPPAVYEKINYAQLTAQQTTALSTT